MFEGFSEKPDQLYREYISSLVLCDTIIGGALFIEPKTL